MNLPRLAVSFAAACLLSAAAAPPARALSLEALRDKGYGAVPLRVIGHNVLAVDVEINGRRERLVVDTGYGGGGLLLHDSAVAELGATATALPGNEGALVAAHGTRLGGLRGARAERVRLGNVELAGVPLLFVNNPFAFRGRGGQGQGDGYLGAPFLAACGAVLDLQNGMMYLHAPGRGAGVDLGPALRSAGMVEVPLDYRPGAGYFVRTRLNGVEARMVVDTGAGFTCVNPGQLEGLRAARWQSRTRMFDAGGRGGSSELALLQELRIGEHAVRTNDVRFVHLALPGGKEAPAGLLGPDLLGRNGAILSCGARQLYLIPADR